MSVDYKWSLMHVVKVLTANKRHGSENAYLKQQIQVNSLSIHVCVNSTILSNHLSFKFSIKPSFFNRFSGKQNL